MQAEQLRLPIPSLKSKPKTINHWITSITCQMSIKYFLLWQRNCRPDQIFPEMKTEMKRNANIYKVGGFLMYFFQHWKPGAFEHAHWLMFIWCTTLEPKRIKAAIDGSFIVKLLKQHLVLFPFSYFILIVSYHSSKEEYFGKGQHWYFLQVATNYFPFLEVKDICL